MNEEKTIEDTKGDGGAQKVTDEVLQMLKSELEQIKSDLKDVYDTRNDVMNTRLCLWDGQSADGRKHASNNDDEDPMPFEGATDARIRLADSLVNEDMMLLVLAAVRGQVQIKGRTAQDTTSAGKMTVVLRYILRNQLGWKWVRELIKLAQFYLGDSPAVALMSTNWRKKKTLVMKSVTVDELLETYLDTLAEQLDGMEDVGQIQAQAVAASQNFAAMLADPEAGDGMLVELLMTFFPGIKETRARKAVKDLRTGAETSFPVAVVSYNGAEVKAKRLYEDWFVPASTTTYQEARISFEPEWLTKTELGERIQTMGWSRSFVDQVLKKEGLAFNQHRILKLDGTYEEASADDYKGLYQVITAYFRSANEDGVPGRYFVTFHPDADETATDKQLLNYLHGLYPGHALQREVLSDRLMDSRGLPELSASQQDLMKLFVDSYGDNAQLSGVPPVITRGRKSMGKLYIAPLAELQAKRDGDYEWMQPPQYPVTIIKVIGEIRRQVDEYFGRPNTELPENKSAIQEEFKVFWWLVNLQEVLKQILQLAQQFLTDEEISRITDTNDQPIARSVEEIQGLFDLEVTYDPRDRDPEYIKQLGDLIGNTLMVMDRDKSIKAAPIVEALLWRLAPDLASKALQPVEKGQQDEIEDEWKNYVKILGGVEPAMVDDGSQNYQVRLSMYESMKQANPQVYDSLPADRLMILQARIQHLEMMATQYGENREIGRTGAKPAMGTESAAQGA